MARGFGKKITVRATEPPKLTDKEWNILGVIGLVFFLMAILQLAGFSDFKAWLEQAGLSQASIWAVAIVLAELWAAAGFFKLRLSPLFRLVSSSLALLVSGFWFLQSMRLVSDGTSEALQSSGFFGGFLEQSPSWWTVLESSVLLFAVIYSINLFKDYFNQHRA